MKNHVTVIFATPLFVPMCLHMVRYYHKQPVHQLAYIIPFPTTPCRLIPLFVLIHNQRYSVQGVRSYTRRHGVFASVRFGETARKSIYSSVPQTSNTLQKLQICAGFQPEPWKFSPVCPKC